jgi:hypothetical protein
MILLAHGAFGICPLEVLAMLASTPALVLAWDRVMTWWRKLR